MIRPKEYENYKGFIFALFPTKEQAKYMHQIFNLNRIVYNKLVEEQKRRIKYFRTYYVWPEKNLNFYSFFTAMRDYDGFNWFKNFAGRVASRNAQNFFKGLFAEHTGQPKFKNKTSSNCFQFQYENIIGSYILLSSPNHIKKQFGTYITTKNRIIKDKKELQPNEKLKSKKGVWVRFKKHCKFKGEISTIAISYSSTGKWTVSFCTKWNNKTSSIHRNPNTKIGIDKNSKENLIATSKDVEINFGNNNIFKGNQVPPLRFEELDELIARRQKKLARMKKGSNRYEKMRISIAKLQGKKKNIRKDYLHKISHSICKEFETIENDKLNIKGLTSSNKGTIETPGKNVKAKSKANKQNLEQGWGMLDEMFKYKSKRYGGQCNMNNPAYGSQKCSNCGFICKENDNKKTNIFKCLECGFTEHRDVNSAINQEKAEGKSVSARGGLGPKSPKETRKKGDVILPVSV